MNRKQIHVLYWQFLFRVVDFELLSASAQGDASKLLSQVAAILIYISLAVAFGGLISNIGDMPPAQKLAVSWAVEQFLISTTMLVVGLFAVLNWELMFPDQRDVFVLTSLPIPSRTLFWAKAAAVIAVLLLAVAALNGAPSLIWPILLERTQGGLIGAIRCFGAYWVTMLAAGTFTFGVLLCMQGLAVALPRQQFLRVSGIFQIVAFCGLIGGYFLLPAILAPQGLMAPRNRLLLEWSPPYWFWGLFQTLNGTSGSIFVKLAWRAWIGVAITVLGSAAAFLLSSLRTLHKIAEEADILPRSRRTWLPSVGPAQVTAIVHFNIRTLFRSRQHRVILSFFFGMAFAILVFFLKGPLARTELAGTAWWRRDALCMRLQWCLFARHGQGHFSGYGRHGLPPNIWYYWRYSAAYAWRPARITFIKYLSHAPTCPAKQIFTSSFLYLLHCLFRCSSELRSLSRMYSTAQWLIVC